MKDYAVQISNLPSLDGSERLEEELKESHLDQQWQQWLLEDMGPFRRRLFEIEKGEENNVSEAAIDSVATGESSSMAFAVFETEQARDEAVHLLSNGLVFRDHAVRVSTPTVEPHGVHWNNIDGTGFNGKLWRQDLLRSLSLVQLVQLSPG
eukprot:Skav212168  [mRNA]  locus=scaffold754:299531:302255:+ [translate_table: standard]